MIIKGGLSMLKQKSTRREFIKKAAYVAPAILTLAALPSFASAGSGENGSGEWRRHGGWRGFWFWRHRVHKWRFHPDENP
jgi:hypothetical protein